MKRNLNLFSVGIFVLIALLTIFVGSQVITQVQLTRSRAASDTIVRGSTLTGSSTDSRQVTTSSIVAAQANQLYVASISIKPNVEVAGVTGLGLNWTKAGAQCGGRSANRTEVWYAYGSPTVAEKVTAQLNNVPKAGVIAVTSYSGVNPANPISGVVTKNSLGLGDTKCDGGTDADNFSLKLTPSLNAFVFSAASIRHYSFNAGSGFSEITELKTSRGGGDDAGLAISERKATSTGELTVGGNTSSDTDYAVVALLINPSSNGSVNPTPTSPTATTPTATLRPGTTATPTTRPTIRPTVAPVPTIAPVPTVRPTTPATTIAPTTAPVVTPVPPVTGDLPCGKFPNASAGCMNVSYQSWFDNVPASAQTMNVNYTPRLLHQHYDCALPIARANGQSDRRAMKVSCQLVRYNSIVPYLSSNSGRYDSCNQGNCYEAYTLNLPSCQPSKYGGLECKNEMIHNVRSGDISSNTEMRFRPNANFVGMDGTRHFVSANWQTGIGYRSSSELTTRYWQGLCGGYQRVILKQSDKFHKGNEAIPTVSGTVTIPFETNGGCGNQFKTFVFLDPSQHTREVGSQSGVTLMETNSHFNGNLTWDTTKTTNGIHSVLFINYEGTNQYVSASGVAVRFNVQN